MTTSPLKLAGASDKTETADDQTQPAESGAKAADAKPQRKTDEDGKPIRAAKNKNKTAATAEKSGGTSGGGGAMVKKTDVEAFIKPFKEKYDQTLEKVRQAKATTDTPYWRDVYLETKRKHKALLDQQIERIREACNEIEIGGTHADHEKDIKDAVKIMAKDREQYESYRGNTINDIRMSIKRCDEIREKTLSTARSQAKDAPMMNEGLDEKAEALVAKWPVPSWDDSTGSIAIDTPK